MSVRPSLRARWAERVVLAEAFVLVHVMAGLQRWVPIGRWSKVLGAPVEVPEAWRGRRVAGLPVAAAGHRERRVARSVARVVRTVPWEPSCLAQAATAQLLLRQQREAGVVVIGLRPPIEPGTNWSAHAWLLGRRGALTGGPAAEGFTATTVFEVAGRLTADTVGVTP